MFDKIRASRTFQTILRILQFLSVIISLGLFSRRLYNLYLLGRRVQQASDGAVEGILVAAVAYTLTCTLINLCLRSKHAPNWLRWLLIVLDVLFIGAFIAVADLTRPNGGPSSASPSNYCYTSSQRGNPANQDNSLCQFPVGTFVLAIFSTILHLLTAVFHEVRDRRHTRHGNGYNANGEGAYNASRV